MANVYIKTVSGGENTSPAATDAVEIDDGNVSKWTTLLNLIKGAVTPGTLGNLLTSDGTNWTSAAPSKELSICKLSTTTDVDMKTAGSTTLYTVPAGKTFIPVMVIIRNNDASLAGGTSYSFTGWRAAVDLSGMTTATTTYRVLYATDNASYTAAVETTAFQITVTTGATAAGTATIDLYGYLF